MPNTKELTSVRELVQRCREHLSQCEDPENWWYGQLYPMVKRYDYEKALRIYEQEQKETSMEGQE